MKTTRTTDLIATALACALSALALPAAAQDLPAAAQTKEQDNWKFLIAPYLWVAHMDASTSLPQNGGSSSANPQHFDTSLSAGLMLAAEVQYRSVGVMADFNWLQLDTKSANSGALNTSVNLKSDYIYSTAAATYSLPLEGILDGKFHAEVLAGARIWSVSSDFTFNGLRDRSFGSSNSKTWVDPVIGAKLRYDFTRHWLFLVQGDVGGFANDDLGYDVFAGPGYQFTDWFMLTLGYRYLHQEYDHNSFSFNANAHGFLLGAVFQF
jgi:opacity protein-like surface antigen